MTKFETIGVNYQYDATTSRKRTAPSSIPVIAVATREFISAATTVQSLMCTTWL